MYSVVIDCIMIENLKTKKQLKQKLDQFKAIQILSLYPESRLYKATKVQTGEAFTIKKIVMPNEQILSKNYMVKEAQILKRIEGHKNVASLFDVIEGHNAIYQVFEELQYSLEEYLDMVRSKGESLDNQEILKFIKQICSGVAHLQMNGIIHGDICAKNIFLNKKQTIKIINLEMANCLLFKQTDPINRQSFICNPFYNSPEAILEFPRPYYKCDPFAVGCIIPQLFNLKPLFKADNDINQLYQYNIILGTPSIIEWSEGHQMATKKRLLLPDSNGIQLQGLIVGHNQTALEVMRKLTKINYLTRCTCSEVLPYFNSYLKKIQTPTLPKTIQFIQNQKSRKSSPTPGVSTSISHHKPVHPPLYQKFNLLSSSMDVRRSSARLAQKSIPSNDVMFFSEYNNLNYQSDTGGVANTERQISQNLRDSTNILIQDSKYYERQRSHYLNSNKTPIDLSQTVRFSQQNIENTENIADIPGSNNKNSLNKDTSRIQEFEEKFRGNFLPQAGAIPSLEQSPSIRNIPFNSNYQTIDHDTSKESQKTKRFRYALDQSESTQILYNLIEQRSNRVGGAGADPGSFSLQLRSDFSPAKTLDLDLQAKQNQRIENKNQEIFRTLDISHQKEVKRQNINNSPLSERKKSKSQKKIALPNIQKSNMKLLDTEGTVWEFKPNQPNYYQNYQSPRDQQSPSNSIDIKNQNINLPSLQPKTTQNLNSEKPAFSLGRKSRNQSPKEQIPNI